MLYDVRYNRLWVVNRPDSDTLICMPGGKTEEGENAMQTVLREVREETGYVFQKEQMLKLYEGVCQGDVDYNTVAFVAFVNENPPGGIEPGLTCRAVTVDEWMQTSAFKEYDAKVLESFKRYFNAAHIEFIRTNLKGS